MSDFCISPSVSVVMPVYNAGRFLYQSLDSAICQTLEDIEIICVNDGSTDGSLGVMREYAKSDKRIKVIDKQNGGYGHAMNVGISAATGEYVMILEPDDFMSPDMAECLFDEAKRLECDVVKSNYWEYEGKTGRDSFENVLDGKTFGKVTNAMDDPWVILIRPCIWSAIYRRQHLIDRRIRFNETPGAAFQDTAFAFKALSSARRISFVENAYLHYRIDNETSSVKSSGKIFNVCDEFAAMESFICDDRERRMRLMPMLQRLKIDTYDWNLGRISEECRELFEDRISLEFIKAKYDGFLDQSLFDETRWARVQYFLSRYPEQSMF